jgi:pyridoxamine 5'-phosphate oxidase-like protein
MPRTMTPDEIRLFFSHGTRTAKLATSGARGEPHVMPVWFVLDGEDLVFTTGSDSVKGRNLRRDPRAAVIVDEEVAICVCPHPWSRQPERGSRGTAALCHRDRRQVHGRRSSRRVRPPKCRTGRAAGAAPTGACDRSDSGGRLIVSCAAIRGPAMPILGRRWSRRGRESRSQLLE